MTRMLLIAALAVSAGAFAAQAQEPPHAPAPDDAGTTAPSVPQVSPGASPAQTPPPSQAPQGPAANTAPSPTPNATPSADAHPSDQTKTIVNEAKLDDHGVKDGIDPATLRAEVMLDRLHASPGVIDGKPGENFQHALEVFERRHDLKVTKALDAKVWAALTQESPKPVLMNYVLTPEDVAGPFYPDLPKDYALLAKLPELGYRTVAQKIGAKFHMGETLLGALNPGADLGKAGTKILVADVAAPPVRGKLAKIVVDKSKSEVLGIDGHGDVLVAYPATIGSEELPSPSGTYKVKGIAFHPKYYYNPKNFVQGDNKEKLTLPAGPNNPVGTVFIALTKPTYGLHGTPDPSKIDKTASHGCVRMTNWDATELAHLTRRNMVVTFRQ